MSTAIARVHATVSERIDSFYETLFLGDEEAEESMLYWIEYMDGYSEIHDEIIATNLIEYMHRRMVSNSLDVIHRYIATPPTISHRTFE